MLLTCVLQIFKNLYSVSLSSLAPSHPNSDSSKSSLSVSSSEPWYSLWTTSAILFTCQLHFILSLEEVALELLQYLQVSSSKQLDLFDECTGWNMFLQGGSRERLRYFSSCSCFWVNFWNLSLLMFLLFLPSKQYVYSSKVLRYFLPRSNLSSADKWGCINYQCFNRTQSFF